MRVYREHEVIDIIKIAALLQGHEITAEEAKAGIEAHRNEVATQHPYYRWILSKGDPVTIQYTKESTPMHGRVVKTHLLDVMVNGTNMVAATYDVDVFFHHAGTGLTETTRMYNVHQAYVTSSTEKELLPA